MPWTVSARGTKAACIAAVNAIPAGTNGNANNQIARFKSTLITEINAVSGPNVSVVASGNFDDGASIADVSVQTIPGVVSNEIASPPNR